MLMQSAMTIGGLTTLIQLFPVFGFGMGLPTVMGVAFAYMPILTMQYGISAIFGAQLVAAFASIFIGMFIGKIRKFFPPIVCGTVVLAIGLSLYSTAINYFGGGSAAKAAGTFGSPEFWILALVTLAVTLACSLFGKGYIKVSGMIIGVGYVVALIMGGIIDFAPVADAAIVSAPIPLHFGLEFHPDAIIMMILMYIVQAVQTIGDVSSTTMGGFGRDAKDTELGGAIKGQGICGMIGALIGGLPTDPFSQNVGLICTTAARPAPLRQLAGGRLHCLLRSQSHCSGGRFRGLIASPASSPYRPFAYNQQNALPPALLLLRGSFFLSRTRAPFGFVDDGPLESAPPWGHA